jgi:hypothetical protein
MRRSNDPSLLRNELDEWQVSSDTGAAMQIEERLALSAFEQFKLDARDRNYAWSCRALSRWGKHGHCDLRR